MHSGLRYETIASTSMLLNAATTASAVLRCGDTVAMVMAFSLWISVQLSGCKQDSSRPVSQVLTRIKCGFQQQEY